MNIKDAIEKRHSVRQYTDKPIEKEKIALINNLINKINSENQLHIQFITNDEKTFNCALARYGKFKSVKNYIALIGKKSKNASEIMGYYGEEIVIYAQTLGLNTCWVGLTYKKNKSILKIDKGEKLFLVISIGYGENQGVKRPSKRIEQVSNISKESPLWFYNGVKSSLLAPTAMNQQKFFIKHKGNKVNISAGKGFYTKTDKGIVRYHFETGAGKENFKFQDKF